MINQWNILILKFLLLFHDLITCIIILFFDTTRLITVRHLRYEVIARVT